MLTRSRPGIADKTLKHLDRFLISEERVSFQTARPTGQVTV